MGEPGNEARGWESLGMKLEVGEPGNEARGWESLGMRLGDGRAWERG